jgi:hypothetical protein
MGAVAVGWLKELKGLHYYKAASFGGNVTTQPV